MYNFTNIWSMFGMSIAMATDSYKASHARQYPKGTRKVKSYFEARGSELADYTVFFGLQYYIKMYLLGAIITKEQVDTAAEFWREHFGSEIFQRENWDYIVDHCGGKLPISIRAVKEGTKVKNKNVLFVIENTDDNCFWLTNFVETLLMKIWYSITVATNSHRSRQLILKYLEKTGTPDAIAFKLHDFGYRGVSSEETAAIGAMSHLISFMGTDSVIGIQAGRWAYNTKAMLGYSVPASEHSTITSWTKAGEIDAFRNMLLTYPTGIVACVSDSFHIIEAMDKWGELKDLILNRDGGLGCSP